MNNVDAEQELNSCANELDQVNIIIIHLGITSNIVPYLTKYAVVRACGAIEQSFKTVIADYCSHRSKKQVKRFLTRRIREGSANPSFKNLCTFLHDFDEDWQKLFKSNIALEVDNANLKTSLQSLVDARNDFAHGGNPNASITNIIQYFNHARRIIEIMDSVIV